MDIDLTRPDRELNPGVDLWEIMHAEDGQTAKGDPKLTLKWFRVSQPSDHLYDTIMLSGGGWPIGKTKLSALLGDGFKGSLDLTDLYSRRMWLATVVETYKGKDRLKVNIDELSHNGYQPADKVPPGCVAPTVPDADEPPF